MKTSTATFDSNAYHQYDEQSVEAAREVIKDLLAQANIDKNSFLATDYLNHFNEIIMLIEMLPTMPDMLGDVLVWKPKSYVEHFKESGFAEKALAIEAYRVAPEKVRAHFDQEVAELDDFLLRSIEDLAEADLAHDAVQDRIQQIISHAHSCINTLNTLIHSSTEATGVGMTNAEDGQSFNQSQTDIDALFD